MRTRHVFGAVAVAAGLACTVGAPAQAAPHLPITCGNNSSDYFGTFSGTLIKPRIISPGLPGHQPLDRVIFAPLGRITVVDRTRGTLGGPSRIFTGRYEIGRFTGFSRSLSGDLGSGITFTGRVLDCAANRNTVTRVALEFAPSRWTIIARR